MLKLVVKRLLSAIAVLFVVSLITFVVLLCIPGDPAQLILGVEATPEKVEALRASMGLDQPWYVQYMHWIQGVLTGNWGTSYLYGENVWTLICQRLPVTFSVALLSMAAALVVSAILGILAALKKGFTCGSTVAYRDADWRCGALFLAGYAVYAAVFLLFGMVPGHGVYRSR